MVGAVVSALADVLRLGVLFLRFANAIRAENLVLRMLLAGYVERGIEPKHVDYATRVSLALFTIRACIREQSAWLGIRLAPDFNNAGGPRISAPDSAISFWVIPTDEELMVARHSFALTNQQ